MCADLSGTYVATCDQEIRDYVESIGGEVIMTSATHERASDRTAEAMLEIEKRIGSKIDIVVMVQGDEPMVTPTMISQALAPFQDVNVNVVNLMSRISTVSEFEDPNEIKVVVDKKDNAIYFSREPIPTRKKGVTDVPMLKQVCIIPFRRDYLIQFNSMDETQLERIESVDMMRIVENGDQVKMVMTDAESYSVDTLEELKSVEKKMRNDKLMASYI